MIPLHDVEALVDAAIAILDKKVSRFKQADTVYVPHMKAFGTVKRVIGKQVDVMLDGKVFIQTSETNVEFAENATIKEESNQFPLNICSNRSQNQSSLSENSVKIKTKQLTLF